MSKPIDITLDDRDQEARLDGQVPTILIVDDSPENLAVLGELLRPKYRVLVATSGKRSLQLIHSQPKPSLVLLDIAMPDMDGYEVLARMQANPATGGIPVIFVTAMTSIEDEERGLELGAVDYITKPLRPPIVLARVRNQLEIKRARDLLSDHNALLEAEVNRRMSENLLIQDVGIHALARLAETRDPETGNHILRTQSYVHQLANCLRDHPRFSSILTDRYIQLLTQSAPLHDIGKVGIPDSILLKPGPLDATEWEIMKRHSQLGSDAIENAEHDAARPVEFLQLAKEIARWHHEKWDGTGYPDGLVGEAIPVSARLMAVADVFDALVSMRIYKSPVSFEEAREIITQGRGRHFDPDATDAFLRDYARFEDIARRHQD